MRHIRIHVGIFSFLFTIVFLTGCSFGTLSSKEVIEQVEEAMEDVESVEIKFKEKRDNFTENGFFTLDMKKEVGLYELENMGMTVYYDGDDILVQDISGSVERWDDFSYLKNVHEQVEFLQEPFELLQDFDEDVIDHIDVEKDKDKEEYVLTYGGDEADEDVVKSFAISYLAFSKYGNQYEAMVDAMDDIEVNDVVFAMTLHDEDYRIKSVKLKITYDDHGEEYTLHDQYTYRKYDDVGKIKALKEDAPKEKSESTGLLDKLGLGEKGDATGTVDVDEASAYVDALIKATVFQDAEGFVKAAPASISREDRESEAELQRDFFKEMYVENTKNNMEGSGVTDEQVEKLADAFLKGLSKTKYKIVHAEAGDEDTVIVTVSVEGLDDTKVYEDTDEKLMELAEDGEMTEENFIEKNMEVLTKMYDDATILDAVEVEVTVMNSDGSYMVPLQDEFLIGGFVQ